MKQLLARSISIALLIITTQTVLGQKAVGELVETKNFVFQAEQASPMSGRTRQLPPGYRLRISGDTVTADLPYYGRAYSAPSNLSGGGITFTSIGPKYESVLDKKNRWQISIKPEGVDDVEELTLTVFENGRADLRVNSRNRQPISFSGYINGK
jgi:hypothetical protein